VIEPKYQTFWRRFWAGVVDGIAFWPVSLLSLLAYREGIPLWFKVTWYLASSFGFAAYVVAMHARYGQTLGKMVTDVKVLDISEGKLSGRSPDCEASPQEDPWGRLTRECSGLAPRLHLGTRR
jgi:uncharacterized RDD family membrane protein YckC